MTDGLEAALTAAAEHIDENGNGSSRRRKPPPASETPGSPWLTDFDAAAYAAGDREAETPTLLRRRDNVPLIYEHRVNELHGEPEGGKGFVVAIPCAEVVNDGGTVLYLDFDQDPEQVVERAFAAGAKPDAIGHLRVRAIDAQLGINKTHDGGRELTAEGAEIMDALCSTPSLRLVVIDGVNNALAMHGMDPNSMTDYADFNRLVSFRLRNAGATVILLDHVTKSQDGRNRWAVGSQQKMTVLDGACYEVVVIEQPAPGRIGRLRLVVRKDRRGGVRAVSTRVKSRGTAIDYAADVVIDSRGEVTTIEVTAPPLDAGDWKPTNLMQKVSIYLEGSEEAQSLTQIETNVEGKTAAIREAAKQLASEGYVERVKVGQAWMHTSVKPYREPTGEDI